MVESAIYFMVGFLCAVLLALLAAPAISRRATRLANARVRLLSPLSESQARADRDALRAVQAIQTVKLEKKLSSAEWERATAKVELEREITQRLRLESECRELQTDLQQQGSALAKLEFDLKTAEATASATEVVLLDVTAQRDAAQRLLTQARAAMMELEAQLTRNRVEIATLSTQVSALEVALSDARASRGRTDSASEQDLREKLRLSELARADQTIELARLMRASVERNDALARPEAERDNLAQSAASIQQRGDQQTVIIALANEREMRAQLQEEVDALRARLSEAATSTEKLSKSDAALRLAIAKLGRDLARSFEPQDGLRESMPATDFARTEPMA